MIFDIAFGIVLALYFAGFSVPMPAVWVAFGVGILQAVVRIIRGTS